MQSPELDLKKIVAQIKEAPQGALFLPVGMSYNWLKECLAEIEDIPVQELQKILAIIIAKNHNFFLSESNEN